MNILSYLGGFFDGEGCVYIATPRQGYVLSANISQNKREVLDIFQAHFGGSICKHRRGYYQWAISSNQARDFLHILVEHAIAKRNQIELALEFQEVIRRRKNPTDAEERGIRETYRLELKALKK